MHSANIGPQFEEHARTAFKNSDRLFNEVYSSHFDPHWNGHYTRTQDVNNFPVSGDHLPETNSPDLGTSDVPKQGNVRVVAAGRIQKSGGKLAGTKTKYKKG